MCLLLKEQRAKHILLFYQTAVVFQNQVTENGEQGDKADQRSITTLENEQFKFET